MLMWQGAGGSWSFRTSVAGHMERVLQAGEAGNYERELYELRKQLTNSNVPGQPFFKFEHGRVTRAINSDGELEPGSRRPEIRDLFLRFAESEYAGRGSGTSNARSANVIAWSFRYAFSM